MPASSITKNIDFFIDVFFILLYSKNLYYLHYIIGENFLRFHDFKAKEDCPHGRTAQTTKKRSRLKYHKTAGWQPAISIPQFMEYFPIP